MRGRMVAAGGSRSAGRGAHRAGAGGVPDRSAAPRPRRPRSWPSCWRSPRTPTRGPRRTAEPGSRAPRRWPVRPRRRGGAGRPGSVLPLPDQVYLDRPRPPRSDLDALAPPVSAEVRAEAETADTDLDRDLSAWRDRRTRGRRCPAGRCRGARRWAAVLGVQRRGGRRTWPPTSAGSASSGTRVICGRGSHRGAADQGASRRCGPASPRSASCSGSTPAPAPTTCPATPGRRVPRTGWTGTCWSTPTCSGGCGCGGWPAAPTASPTCGPRCTWCRARRSTTSGRAGTGGWPGCRWITSTPG